MTSHVIDLAPQPPHSGPMTDTTSTTATVDPAFDAEAAIQRYLDMWHETDPTARRAIVDAVWTEDARSVDALSAVEGRAAIDAMVAAVQTGYPGHRFRHVGEPLRHNDRLLFFWELVDGDGAVVMPGLDAVRLAPDGRFADLAGFFGPRPAS
jgi:hypothetical protein